MMVHATDLNLAPREIAALTSPDALAAFLTSLGYDTGHRKPLTPEAIGLAGDAATLIRSIEILSEDPEGFLRVVFVHLRSLTARSRNDLARVLGRTNVDHLLVLTSDFDTLEFVLLNKRRRELRGPGDVQRIQVVPLSLAVARKAVATKELRAIRRFTWTCRDGLEQFDKLRSVFEAAAFSENYFCNRALFADHYLLTRLREDAAWQDNPSHAFQRVKSLMQDARQRWLGKGEQVVRQELYEPLFDLLGFKAKVNKPAGDAHTKADYLLAGPSGKTAAFVYAWDRWLDGPDFNIDPQTPEENPGACVVTALDEGLADWIIVTNGRQWRLYSRHAHSRATNFYEVDLAEALVASGDTDPNEAFRYWWLFFRAEAFAPPAGRDKGCWLDAVAEGSREYAKQLGERLEERIFVTIFPHLAQGFLEDRRRRLGIKRQPSDAELHDAYEATLTLLYRLLFLLYAESRDLLPIREAPYRAASLMKIKEEIAQQAGIAESEAGDRLARAYSATETALYDRLTRLCEAMDCGEPTWNVPIYNGGLFITRPDDSAEREHRIARFLAEHKVPDRCLAPAIDRLARDPDDKTLALVFIDYKSLEVRHLGSIYEGLLEFKLKIAEDDLTTKTEDKKEKYIPLSAAKPRRGQRAEAVVRKGEVYLSNDKADRKASGSYYTPDPIVEYIVEHTVGPVLAEKLEKLRPELRKVRKTFDRQLANARDPRIHSILPSPCGRGAGRDGTTLPSPSGRGAGGEGGSAASRDVRQEAADKTYDAHRDLVEDLFDFRTLDPAMGSGHFLVEAVDFITDRLLTFLNQFPINPVSFMLDRTRRNIMEALGEQGVSVDPDKLTEVNLLKRHVLKRCIYGVDLNPMAVELAKVSLWLDAFTIGAPLSFLDHHLRCGNSLIGATFKDLEEVTKPTAKRAAALFGIDYEPLLRAIRHVLQVNKMADATAAEVKQSASEYDGARKDLAGYQILLDLLVAKHFGYAEAPGLLEYGSELNLSSRERFLASLAACGTTKKGEKPATELVAEVEALARRPDLRFFHWEVEFPEVFFGFEDADQRHIKHKDQIAEGSAGFDAVVGNPPYDVLASEELGVDLTDVLDYFRNQPVLEPAHGGKMNLYKLFICRAVDVGHQSGAVGQIVPMPLLGDEQSAGVRRMLLRQTAIIAIEAFPQKDDPTNRVFPEAKLSTCVFATLKSDDNRAFRCRVHPGKDILEDSPSVTMRRDDVVLYDPTNQPIVSCSQDDWDIVTKITGSRRLGRLGEFCTAYQGEVNETTDGKKGHISNDPKDGPQILRGSAICLYTLREQSQGEVIFLRKTKYLQGKEPETKAWHHKQARVGFQRKSPQNNFRRLIAAPIPASEFCCDSISYVPVNESAIASELLLAFLCSKLLDWWFRLGSTNALVNDYQFQNLPVSVFEVGDAEQSEVERFCAACAESDFASAFSVVEPLLATSPFPATVAECMSAAVQRIIDIERSRGEIARTERSALDAKAQPLQDLLDRMIYRMAGLTDDEARGLEGRLATML